MKSILYTLMIFSLVVLSACDEGFDEINTNKTAAGSVDPVFQLNNAIISINGGGFAGGSPLIYDLGIVQQVISPNSGVLTGANYNQDNRNATQTLWQGYYRNVIKNTIDVIDRIASLEGTNERQNLYNMTRILQAFAFMVLTDEYGDIPYIEAGRGYLDQNFFPSYDSQEDIYNDIIKELREATAALDPARRVESSDILYAGDIAKWRKFGNSLLLRAGMRLSKVDPAKAENIVSAIPVGDLILVNAENARIVHDANYQNSLGTTLNGTEAANFYLAEPFVNYLKNTNDPRLPAISVRYKGAKSGTDQANTVNGAPPQGVSITYAVADQVGMPMGHDNSTIPAVATELGLASFYDFSQVDRKRMMKINAPYFLVTAAQNYLLLAEARQRGWIDTGTAAEYFAAGIRAHMEQLAQFDVNSTVAGADIDAYLANHPYNEASGLEQINTQYWIASFLNGPEAFANFRRSGYPDLDPNPYPGREVEFIYRLTYPVSEGSVNEANVGEAIQRMGPDELDTRVWWDKP